MTLVVVFLAFKVAYNIGDLRQLLWPRTAAVGLLADVLTVAGLVVAVWARAVLGRNWSGRVVLKQDHDLVQRGPYACVRHPIYSGLLLMGLGTAVESGRLTGFVILAAVAILFAVKAQFEERLMIRHFPEAYPDYRRRVKALIPGVW